MPPPPNPQTHTHTWAGKIDSIISLEWVTYLEYFRQEKPCVAAEWCDTFPNAEIKLVHSDIFQNDKISTQHMTPEPEATHFRFSFRGVKKGSCQLLAKLCAQSSG